MKPLFKKLKTLINNHIHPKHSSGIDEGDSGNINSYTDSYSYIYSVLY